MTTTHTPPVAPPWQSELDIVVDLMRNLSLKTDPQEAALLYGEGIGRLNIFPTDRYLSISRRGLQKPAYRITRCSTWKHHPDPWKEPEKIPLFTSGLLSDILYSNQPAIIDNLRDRLDPAEPAFEYLHDMNFLVALPHFDAGESINVGIILMKEGNSFPIERLPMLIFQANLWGRATLNLVTQQKLQAAYNAMQRELEVVAGIQRSLLPRTLPQIKDTQIAAHYQTSQQAGGDYYDFFPLPDNQWGIFIADVSGHGTPAAVLMAITHAIAHTHPGHHMPPPTVLSFINEKLSSLYTRDTGNFVTAFYGIFDPCNRRLTYSSAGHPYPRLIRSGRVIPLDGETSFPLGVNPTEHFQTHTIELLPHDTLLFYTDGIPDTFNPAGDSFGIDRLDEACRNCTPAPEPLIQRILNTLTDFAQNAPITDDRTLVALSL